MVVRGYVLLGMLIWATGVMSLSAAEAVPENRIDTIRPDAPELAAYGEYAIGVRTLKLVNPNQIDIAKIDAMAPLPDPLSRYDRPLTVEIWYPAQPGAAGSTTLTAFLRDGKTEVALHGKAVRDAAPVKDAKALPLVIISHGFPGNRYLLSPIAENIASKGYVVVSIDHTDSTYDNLTTGSFHSTLVNRPLDQRFVLDQIAKLSHDPHWFLSGKVDADNTALIGYSMGGYGALITAGAGLTQSAVDGVTPPWMSPFGTLGIHRSGSASHLAMADRRIKTAVVFAPAGWKVGFFDAESMKGVRMPLLFIGGSVDDVVGYDDGIRPTWKAAKPVDRALLTFENANHNAGPVLPVPNETYLVDQAQGSHIVFHYLDPVWDNARMNNVSEHFITAWLGKYLKGDVKMDAYFDLVPESNDGSWKGFPDRSAKGLRFERLKAGE
jgi:predicted dienelactone hydrolase